MLLVVAIMAQRRGLGIAISTVTAVDHRLSLEETKRSVNWEESAAPVKEYTAGEHDLCLSSIHPSIQLNDTEHIKLCLLFLYKHLCLLSKLLC